MKGYEAPIAFCLFKIAMYTLALLFIKFNDSSSMTCVINNFKEANFESCLPLKEEMTKMKVVKKH